MRTRTALWSGLAVVALAGAPGAAGADEPRTVPLATGLTLDGRLDEPAWKDALVLPADTIHAPPPPPGTEKVALTPEVRLLHGEGRLWVGVRLAEDPGMSIGVRLMLGPADLAASADAVACAYLPQEIRSAAC